MRRGKREKEQVTRKPDAEAISAEGLLFPHLPPHERADLDAMALSTD